MLMSSGLMSTAPGPHLAMLRMVLLASGYGLMLMVSVLLMPSIPAIAQHFGSVALAQLIVISPVILKIIGGPAAAWLMHRFGRRRPLLANLLLLTMASALSIVVDTFWPLLALRLCMGFAGAAISTIATVLVGDYFQGAQRDRALSWTGMAPMLGAIVGFFGGGLVAQIWGWQWANALLLLAVPIWLGAFFSLPEPRQINTSQAATGSPAGQLPRNILYFLGIAAFTTIISVLSGYQLPLLMAEHGIDSAGFAGAVMALSSVLGAIAAGFYPTLRRRLGPVGIFIWIVGICGGAYGLLAVAEGGVTAGKWWIGVVAPLVGLGGGLLYPFCTGWAIEHASAAARPRTVGLVMSAIFVGQVSCPFLAEIVRSSFSARTTFGVAAGVALIAAMLAGFFNHRSTPQRFKATSS